MDRTTWTRYFDAAPVAVQDYLLDDLSVDQEQHAQTKLAYDHDAWDRLMDVVWELVFVGLSRQEFRTKIGQLAGDRKPEEVEQALLLNVVLPLADMVSWDVETRLQELGTPMSDIQIVPQISLRPVSYGGAARRIASQAKISLLGEEMIRRLREGLMSYLKGVRTIEQMKELLQRSQSDAGLGLSPDQANKFCEAMLAFVSTTEVMSEQEYADWLTNKEREATIMQAEAMGTPLPKTDEEEAAALAASAPKGERTKIDDVVDQVMAEVAVPNLEEYIQKRLRNVISTRVRDVRSSIQTRSILERESKVGGVGLEAAEAQRVAGVIEKAYESSREQIMNEEKTAIQATLATQQIKIDERKKRDSEEHAKWFEEKTKKAQAEDAMRKAAFGIGVQAPPADLTPGQAAFAAAATNMKGVNVKLSSPSMAATDTRPSMDDVRAPVQLVGLAEELGNMGLAEFRRLAKDPVQAEQKILQKLETLKAESFDRWTEGVEAWRRCPLQQQYLRLVTESFSSGKPVAELAGEKRKQDSALPSGEELAAIISLNSQIQL